jgi:hypothetical protein
VPVFESHICNQGSTSEVLDESVAYSVSDDSILFGEKDSLFRPTRVLLFYRTIKSNVLICMKWIFGEDPLKKVKERKGPKWHH